MNKILNSLALAGMLNLGCSVLPSNVSPPNVSPSNVSPSNALPPKTAVSESITSEKNNADEKLKNNSEEEQMKESLERSLTLVQGITVIQQKELGISYEGMHFTIEPCPVDMPSSISAAYFPEKNILCINQELLKGISLDTKGENVPANDEMLKELLSTLCHELSHVYMDQRSEFLGKGDWPDFQRFEDYLKRWEHIVTWYDHSQFEDILFARKTLRDYQERYKVPLTEALLVRIIAEGTAEYFRLLGKKPDTISDTAFPQNIDELLPLETTVWAYPLGYHLVKPILDAFGSRAIDYLITHEPESTGNLAKDAVHYRQQAMEELERTK